MKETFYRVFQNTGLIIVSLGLLFGGIGILRTNIPFWSLVYGLPAIFLGISLSVVSFNEIAKNKSVKATDYHVVSCNVCKKNVMVPMLTESSVCVGCQTQMARRLQLVGVLLFTAISIPVTMHLVGEKQTIQQRAHEIREDAVCIEGEWFPSNCRCAYSDKDIDCSGYEIGRVCDGVSFCCKQHISASWMCKIVEP